MIICNLIIHIFYFLIKSRYNFYLINTNYRIIWTIRRTYYIENSALNWSASQDPKIFIYLIKYSFLQVVSHQFGATLMIRKMHYIKFKIKLCILSIDCIFVEFSKIFPNLALLSSVRTGMNVSFSNGGCVYSNRLFDLILLLACLSTLVGFAGWSRVFE